MLNELIVEISLLVASFLCGYLLQRYFSKLKQEEKKEEENPLSVIMNDNLKKITWNLILDELLEKIKDVRMGKRDAKDVYKDIEQFKESLSVTMFTDVKGEVLHLNDSLLHNDDSIHGWEVNIQGCEVDGIADKVYLKLIHNETNYEYRLSLKSVKEKLIKV